ncbi:Hypothetical protein NTJ_11974 [Nesidiocoris tenuis]|uniref:Uncharacterized protein n=1 Tax=Nesidiocoris tenuis TaxID=355587 RepID=A0ABN7B8P3_9HEMI|nr:Hypothetical protein NTJ_11974 [Nesidiocoris tenuis]
MQPSKAIFVALFSVFLMIGSTLSDYVEIGEQDDSPSLAVSSKFQPRPDFWGRVNDYLDIKMAQLGGNDQILLSNSSWIRVCDNFTDSVEGSLDLGVRFLSALKIDPTIAVANALYTLLDCPSSVFEGTKCLISSLANLKTVLKPIISAGLPFAREALKLIPEVANGYRQCFYF